MDKDNKTIEELATMAGQNDAEAMYRLGMRYLKGVGTEADSETAYKLIRQAAEMHHPEAECAYGCALYSTYQQDRSKSQILCQAVFWLGLACNHGLKDAAKRLEEILQMERMSCNSLDIQ